MNEFLFGLVAMVSWGLYDFIISSTMKKGLSEADAIFWPQLVSAVVSFVAVLFYGAPEKISAADIGLGVLSAALISVGSFFYYLSMNRGKVSVAAAVGSLWAVVVVLGGVFVFGEQLSLRESMGVCCALLGAALVSLKIGELERWEAGVPFALLAALSFGLSFLVVDILTSRVGWMFQSFMLSAFSSALSFSPVRQWHPLFFVIGLLGAIALFSYSFGVHVGRSSIVAAVSSASPAVTIMLAKLFWREKTDWTQNLGFAAVVVGLLLLS